MDNVMKTGTTTIGIVCKDCVIMAADMRTTAGNFIANKDKEKVLLVNERMAVTTSGTASSNQLLVKHLKSHIKLLEMRTRRQTTVKEVANLLSSWTYSMIRQPSMVPDVAHLLLAGSDQHGQHLYDVFFDGTLSEEKDYATSGSGSIYTLGILENKYKQGMTQDEGIKLAEECIDAAIQRDTASGNGINIFVIDKEGARKVITKKVNTHLQ